MCKQKITERCVNISKIKKITLFPPLPLPRKGAKRVPRKLDNKECNEFREIREFRDH